MKKSLFLSFLFLLSISLLAETPLQSVYVDFGPAASPGLNTASPTNGIYWNNHTALTANSSIALVNGTGTASGFTLVNVNVWLANGGSGFGGLVAPDPALLGDMAVANATQDYFFVQSGTNGTNSASIKITGLNTTKGYKFYLFGTRDNASTRITQYKLTGSIVTTGTLQTSGTAVGANSANGNNNNIYTTPILYSDVNGEIKIEVGYTTGGYGYLGVMKVEEYSAPFVNVTGISVSGNNIIADGATTQMSAVVTPANASVTSVTWSVSDASIATITSTGLLIPKKNGTVTVTATTKEPNSLIFGSSQVTISNQLTRFPVTLKVIDQTLGAKTNKATDQNGVNVIAYLSAGLAPAFWTNWWYPFYDGETGISGAQLAKNTNDWTWQAQLQAVPGTYQWNPYMKTLGWASMNKRIIYYGQTDNLSFTISPTGEITGTTQVVISATKFPVTLKIVDRTKGVKTNDQTSNDETNLYIAGGTVTNAAVSLYTESILPTGDWWYALYSGVARCPGGIAIEKSDTAWVWSATVNASTGCYAWKPGAKSIGWKDINTTMYVYNATDANLPFNVALDGTVTGLTSLVIPADVSTAINNASSRNVSVQPTLFNEKVTVTGAENLIEIYNSIGMRVVNKQVTGNVVINTISLSKGAYILVVDKQRSFKLVK